MLLEYWFLVSPVRSWEYTRGHRRALWTAETRSSLCFACFRARFATLFLPFLSFFLPFFLFFHAENAVERNIIVCQDARWKSASHLSCAECFHQQLCRLDTRMVSYQSWELRGKMKYRRDVCFLFFPSLFFLFFLENFQILLYFVQRNKKSIQ